MALAGMLSALKSLILEVDAIPQDSGERRVLYAKLFLGLSEEELEDLARIPPAQIQSYTRFAVSADRSALQGHLPLTFALLRREWPRLRDEEFHSEDFVKTLLRRYPWKGYHTLDLAKNFLQMLRDEIPQDTSLRSLILDVAETECHSLRIKRHLQGVPSADKRGDLATLAHLTVPQFLEVRLRKNPQLGFLHSAYDIVLLMRQFSELEKKDLPPTYPEGPGWFIVARDPENLTGPNAVSEELFEFLQSSPQEFCVAELAPVCISEKLRGQASEAEQFRAFMSETVRLLEAGIIYLPQRSRI